MNNDRVTTNVNLTSIKIENSWKKILEKEFSSPYFEDLRTFLIKEKSEFDVYPPGDKIFEAYNRTPFDRVKVVIIGQDPYHGPMQANGLCFSVSDGIRKPPSLINIFKELQCDIQIPVPLSGNLEKWADEGVFLLNATLTVRASSAASHQGKGWELFTDATIKAISDNKKYVVFLLWGKFAQAKESLIDVQKHFVLKAPHPSPLAGNKFLGCKHFSKTNQLLIESGIAPINWSL